MTERRVLVIDTATHAVVTGLAAVTASDAREVSSRWWPMSVATPRR